MKISTLLSALLFLAFGNAFGASRPNLLFIFTDDHRADSVGYAEESPVRTPNLDALAERGTSFRNAFVTLSICSPSRAAALTGRYNSANGVTGVGRGFPLNPDEATFAGLLKEVGYRTAVTGKWHLDESPADCGFDFSSTCWANGTWYGREFTRSDGSKVRPEGFVDDFVAEESIRFLNEAAKGGENEPFILWMSTQVPHMDHQFNWPADERYQEHYDEDAMPLPETWKDDLAGKPYYLAQSRSRTKALEYGYDHSDAIRKHHRDYYAAVEQVDASIGKVLQELDRLGLRENTWIVFQGDNGWMLGEHGFTSKVLPYEESIRVPMMVIPPDGSAQTCDELALGIDIAPTLLEIAGIDLPEKMHGRSLLPLVRKEPDPGWRKAFLYEAPSPQLGSRPLWAVRTRDFKYIETDLGDGERFRELYDLDTDPIEQFNVADEPSSADLVTDLAQQLRSLKAEIEPSPEQPRRSYSGIYPHLAFFNDENECGTGAVAPWADRLWAITYAPHMPQGSSDKLYEIDSDLKVAVRPESIGGTPANRMIHRESQQLFIGPYAINQDRNVRAISYENMFGRPTGNARHLEDPANKIYYASMEEGFYEVDVRSLQVTTLFHDEQLKDLQPKSNLPGYHGKGLYSGQGRLVYANNGENSSEARRNPFVASGALAEWDGKGDWSVVLRNQFTEVTGPGGIFGNENSHTDPIWSIGWDARSLILMLLDGGKWHRYRLPKASHSYDGAHGWNTEWPRIREIGEGDDLLMTMHGLFWRFPKKFSTADTSGILPRSTYLKVIGDFCRWNDRVVFGCDDTAKSEFLNKRSAKGEIAAPQSQSNLWFVKPEQLDHFGPVIGRGAVWLDDAVAANEPSDAFLFKGFANRAVHLYTDAPATLTLEADVDGKGEWTPIKELSVDGYAWHSFDDAEPGVWIRVRSTASLKAATAWFTFGDRDERAARPSVAKFKGLARADDAADSITGGVIRARSGNRRTLHYAARDADGKAGYYELDEHMKLRRVENFPAYQWLQTNAAVPSRKGVLEVQASSVLYTDDDGQRFRLPRGDAAYDQPAPLGWGRLSREVSTERDLFNCHGTFYELPAENAAGFIRVRPVASHNLRLTDYCSYRGLLVLSGLSNDASEANLHVIPSDDGKTGLWIGAIDDLWQLGKPIGEGGPWLDTTVEADVPSDPYLMTGYDRKSLRLSSAKSVTITAEIDITGTSNWQPWKTFNLTGAGDPIDYTFPDAFQAYWIRFVSAKDTTATAQLTYQ